MTQRLCLPWSTPGRAAPRCQGCFSLATSDALADALLGGAGPQLAPGSKLVGQLGVEKELPWSTTSWVSSFMRQPSHGVLFEGGGSFPTSPPPHSSFHTVLAFTHTSCTFARHFSLPQGFESNRLCLNFDSTYTKRFSLLNLNFVIYKTEIVIPTYGLVLRMKP